MENTKESKAEKISLEEYEVESKEYTKKMVEALNAKVLQEEGLGDKSTYFQNKENRERGLPVFEGKHVRFENGKVLLAEELPGPRLRTKEELEYSNEVEYSNESDYDSECESDNSECDSECDSECKNVWMEEYHSSEDEDYEPSEDRLYESNYSSEEESEVDLTYELEQLNIEAKEQPIHIRFEDEE